MMHFTHPDCLRDDAKALNMDSGVDCHQEGNPKLRNKIVKTKGAIVVAHSEEGCHKALSRCPEWSRDMSHFVTQGLAWQSDNILLHRHLNWPPFRLTEAASMKLLSCWQHFCLWQLANYSWHEQMTSMLHDPCFMLSFNQKRLEWKEFDSRILELPSFIYLYAFD